MPPRNREQSGSKDRVRNVQNLKQELLRIAETDEVRNTRIFALSLAYLLNEHVPHDRTTDHVVEEAWK